MEENKKVADLWAELKLTVENLEKDMAKNVEKNNVSAGVRVRKSVRKLRALGAEIIKVSTNADKELVSKRKNEKQDKKPA